jgi:restriction system protein
MYVIDGMDGIAFENFVAKLLRNNGYKKVEITKASVDYGVDIIAVKDSKNYAFQCKCYSSNLGIKPIQQVYSDAKMYRADAAVVVTNWLCETFSVN